MPEASELWKTIHEMFMLVPLLLPIFRLRDVGSINSDALWKSFQRGPLFYLGTPLDLPRQDLDEHDKQQRFILIDNVESTERAKHMQADACATLETLCSKHFQILLAQCALELSSCLCQCQLDSTGMIIFSPDGACACPHDWS